MQTELLDFFSVPGWIEFFTKSGQISGYGIKIMDGSIKGCTSTNLKRLFLDTNVLNRSKTA